MAKDYVCLACGAQFKISIDAMTEQDKTLCPICESTNTFKIEPQNPSNFTGG